MWIFDEAAQRPIEDDREMRPYHRQCRQPGAVQQCCRDVAQQKENRGGETAKKKYSIITELQLYFPFAPSIYDLCCVAFLSLITLVYFILWLIELKPRLSASEDYEPSCLIRPFLCTKCDNLLLIRLFLIIRRYQTFVSNFLFFISGIISFRSTEEYLSTRSPGLRLTIKR